MLKRNQNKTLIIIAGPTAVGKTKLSVELALMLNCPIISCDSRQFYKEMTIGTAKPTEEEKKGVPHYFLDFLSIDQEYTAGMFEFDGLEKLDELFCFHDFVIMVGGSTLYVDAITKGFDELPKNLALRNELIHFVNENGVDALKQELKEKDPEYFNQVDLNNSVRIMRAIEVIRSSGMKYSTLRNQKAKERPFEMIKIGLNDERDILYDRINHRVDEMIEKGLEKEAKFLYPKKGITALKTVGYQEFFEFFDGNVEKETAIELIKRNSRRYAKRQISYFKRDSDFTWFEPNKFDDVLTFIQSKI